jgi:uncharacterized protein YkwD
LPVRRALAAVLALPVLATIYLSLALHRGPTRLALALGVGGMALVAAVGIPAGTIGVPTARQAPLAASALGPAIATGRGLSAAMIVDFDAPMDAATVAPAVRIDPPTEVRLAWSDDATRLVVEPVGTWRAGTFYTVTVGTSASDRDGRPLASPLRAAFLTRAETSAHLAVTDRLRSGAALDTSIVLSFDRPVPIARVLRAFRITPAVPGQLLVATDGPDDDDSTLAENFVWEPDRPFAAKTRYTVRLAGGLVDGEGAAVAVPAALAFKTTTAPSVVRFRPRAGTEKIERAAVVSVRFTRSMERSSTRDAFVLKVDGKKVAGSVRFAEHNTVLVFDPKDDFPYGATVVMQVADTAVAADGTQIDRSRTAKFTVVEKPKPKPKAKAAKPAAAHSSKPKPKPTTKPKTVTRPASGSWLGAEKYLLTLMNCTRGGGWVLSDGSCSSPGGSGIAPLAYHGGISDKVSRPYAKKLAASGVCSHFYGGDPGDRMRAAGYTGYQWGENLGCRYFRDPRDAAVSLVRFFQSERSWSPPGGHWVNMMSRKYTHAGIGLWVSGGNLRFVVNFYNP